MPRVAKKQNESGAVNVASTEDDLQTAMVEIPVSERCPTGFQIHVDLTVNGEAAMTLRRIAKAYDRQQATLKNGTRVVNPTTALRKILEEIGDNIP